jgi:methyltransferase (TIGR00027 family)
MPLASVPSVTAELVCLARALESRLPPPERLVDDPYAVGFLRRPQRLAARTAAFAGRAGEVTQAWLDPGLVGVIAARHGWMDAGIRRSLAQVDQVLVLGAGYDSRAWRLPLGGRMIVEIDHPATAARKLRRLAAMNLAPIPAVTADLAREPLPHVLRRTPLHPHARTLVIWEGVSMYLQESEVYATLQGLHHAWPECQIFLDIWTGGPGWWGRAEGLGSSALAVLGEPIRYRPSPQSFADLARSIDFDIRATVDIAAFAAHHRRRAWPALTGVHLATATKA